MTAVLQRLSGAGMVTPEPAADLADGLAAWIELDLDLLADNWHRVLQHFKGGRLGAVVKADAYGLGLEAVVRRLHAEGCRLFWVGGLEEGRRVRRVLPAVEIFTLNGLGPEAPSLYRDDRIVPVLGSLEDLRRAAAAGGEAPLPVALLLDCGLTRLGLDEPEVASLRTEPAIWQRLSVQAWLTQLARFEFPDDPENRAQVERFRSLLQDLPPAPWSLACSAAIFMDSAFHGVLARVGSALYGVQGTPGRHQPLLRPVSAHARVMRVVWVEAGTPVGYSGSFVTARRSRIATLAAGYAQGLPMALSNSGLVAFAGQTAPLVGRISMSLSTVDVTDLPETLVQVGSPAELVGQTILLEEQAARAGTVSNELLIALGRGLPRVYRGDPGGDAAA